MNQSCLAAYIGSVELSLPHFSGQGECSGTWSTWWAEAGQGRGRGLVVAVPLGLGLPH